MLPGPGTAAVLFAGYPGTCLELANLVPAGPGPVINQGLAARQRSVADKVITPIVFNTRAGYASFLQNGFYTNAFNTNAFIQRPLYKRFYK